MLDTADLIEKRRSQLNLILNWFKNDSPVTETERGPVKTETEDEEDFLNDDNSLDSLMDLECELNLNLVSQKSEAKLKPAVDRGSRFLTSRKNSNYESSSSSFGSINFESITKLNLNKEVNKTRNLKRVTPN